MEQERPVFACSKSLRHDPGFQLVAVVDDSPRLWNRRLQRLPVVSPAAIPELIQSWCLPGSAGFAIGPFKPPRIGE